MRNTFWLAVSGVGNIAVSDGPVSCLPLIGGNPYGFDNPLVVKGTDDACLKPQGLHLQKNVLAHMASLDVCVGDTTSAILSGASCIISCYDQHHRRLRHPHLIQCVPGHGSPHIPFLNAFHTVGFWTEVVNTRRQGVYTSFTYNSVDIDGIEGAG
jgi:hypothetical protein